MDPTTAVEQGVGSRAACSDPGDRAALPQDAKLLWQALRGLAHDRLELAALETQRAGESLVAMVVAGMLVAGLLLSAWVGLQSAAILALTSLGVMEMPAETPGRKATLKPKGGGRAEARPKPGSAERRQRRGGPTATTKGDANSGPGAIGRGERKPVRLEN
jgi:hypothetical protein